MTNPTKESAAGPHGNCSRCQKALTRVEARDRSHVCAPSTPHTPGPWLVEPCQLDHGASLVIVAKDSHVLAKIEPINDDGEEVDADNAQREPDDYANAALMAAAPDLLAFVKRFVAFSSRMRPGQKFTSADIQGLSCDAYAAYEKAVKS